MGSALKPGGMGDKNADQNAMPSDFAGSMAAAMEAALNDLLSADGMKTFAVDTNAQEARDRRRLFVAIAQGIVHHLDQNVAALGIFDNSTNTQTNENIQIQTDPANF
ncbi:MAG TPA: hypothetical protein VGS20_08615 [Candidatus Acidoferrales bacterium]|nr:hypothetical protein [Candidatus Acidoferrales bacterium]